MSSNFMFIAVLGGIMSLIDGSYEYYHYLHDGIDDNVMLVFTSGFLSIPSYLFFPYFISYRPIQLSYG
jgi:uncharacterized membrane protein HdeD (DUF308 family)